MNAAQLAWSGFRHFDPDEWPYGVLESMDPQIIQTLANIRNKLPDDHAMIPSPVPAAHVRTTGDSRHSTRRGERLSDATDVFMHWRHVWRAWMWAQRCVSVGGLGIYTDMKYNGEVGAMAMLHIDCRQDRVVWVGHGRDPVEYTYLVREPIKFHRIISERAKG